MKNEPGDDRTAQRLRCLKQLLELDDESLDIVGSVLERIALQPVRQRRRVIKGAERARAVVAERQGES